MKRFLSIVLAIVTLCSIMPTAFAASDEAFKAADELHSLGLFNGTGTDINGNPIYELNRAPTRHEAVTMLVRLLGKGEDALAGTWDIPFTDVAEWAKPYVGYAYANGLTSGTSATTYSGDDTVTASQYITFLLRALGYDSSVDFQWNKAWELSDAIGLTSGEYNAETNEFLRGDVALLSKKALYVNTKTDNSILYVKILASKSTDTKSKNYDPVLNNWPDMIEMAHPRLSLTEVQKMVDMDLSLDEVADIIATTADLVQYLHQKGYTADNGDLLFRYGGYEWSVNRSASTVFEKNKGNCGGGSNLVNYILRGDFDAQGYVGESANQGGHIYNYFKQDGIYYFFDLTRIVCMGEYREGYKIFSTDDPQKFSDYYIGDNHVDEERNDAHYLLFQFMYEYEGDHLPKGSGNERTMLNKPYGNVLPKQYEDVTTILFVEDGMSGAVFAKAPEQSQWPKEAQ